MAWLSEEKEKGSEIIQHGYIHYQPNREAKGLETIRRKLLTKDEAEFIGLDYQQARKAIAKGKEILEKAGFESLGFITSPTWQQSKPTIKAIKDCGFRYYTTKIISSVFTIAILEILIIELFFGKIRNR